MISVDFDTFPCCGIQLDRCCAQYYYELYFDLVVNRSHYEFPKLTRNISVSLNFHQVTEAAQLI